jgi:hypothetical protein
MSPGCCVLSLKHQGHTKVLSRCLSHHRSSQLNCSGRSADFETPTNQEKCLKLRQLNKRANGSVKVMRIIYLFHLITSLVCLALWGTMFGIARSANGLARER